MVTPLNNAKSATKALSEFLHLYKGELYRVHETEKKRVTEINELKRKLEDARSDADTFRKRAKRCKAELDKIRSVMINMKKLAMVAAPIDDDDEEDKDESVDGKTQNHNSRRDVDTESDSGVSDAPEQNHDEHDKDKTTNSATNSATSSATNSATNSATPREYVRGSSQAVPNIPPRTPKQAYLGFNNIIRPVFGSVKYASWKKIPGNKNTRALMGDNDQVDRIRGIIRCNNFNKKCLALEMTKDAALSGNPWMSRHTFARKYCLIPNANKSTRERYGVKGKSYVFSDYRIFGNPRTPWVSTCRPQVVDYRQTKVSVLKEDGTSGGKETHEECRVNPIWVREWLCHYPLTVDVRRLLADCR